MRKIFTPSPNLLAVCSCVSALTIDCVYGPPPQSNCNHLDPRSLWSNYCLAPCGHRPHHTVGFRGCVLKCFTVHFPKGFFLFVCFFLNVYMNFNKKKKEKRKKKEANVPVKVWHSECLVSESLISKYTWIEFPCSNLDI